jgi:hypothetical protein
MCRRPHPWHGVMLQSGDRIGCLSDLVTSDDFQRHLADPPSPIPCRFDDGRSGAVIPGVEEPPCGPDARPVSAQSARTTREHLIRPGTTESMEETSITGSSGEERKATRYQRLFPSPFTLCLDALAGGLAPDARHGLSMSQSHPRKEHSRVWERGPMFLEAVSPRRRTAPQTDCFKMPSACPISAHEQPCRRASSTVWRISSSTAPEAHRRCGDPQAAPCPTLQPAGDGPSSLARSVGSTWLAYPSRLPGSGCPDGRQRRVVPECSRISLEAGPVICESGCYGDAKHNGERKLFFEALHPGIAVIEERREPPWAEEERPMREDEQREDAEQQRRPEPVTQAPRRSGGKREQEPSKNDENEPLDPAWR